jgi:hypothetical protein
VKDYGLHVAELQQGIQEHRQALKQLGHSGSRYVDIRKAALATLEQELRLMHMVGHADGAAGAGGKKAREGRKGKGGGDAGHTRKPEPKTSVPTDVIDMVQAISELREIYAMYSPTTDVDYVLQRFSGRELELLRKAKLKYCK